MPGDPDSSSISSTHSSSSGSSFPNSSPTLLSYISGLFSSLEPASVYRSMVVLSSQLMNADAAILFSTETSERGKPLSSILATGDLPEGFLEYLTAPVPGTPASAGVAFQQSGISKLAKGYRITGVPDVMEPTSPATAIDRQLYLDYGYRSYLVAPILGKSEVLVVLVLYFNIVKQISKLELSGFSTFCREAGMALENAEKYAAVSTAVSSATSSAHVPSGSVGKPSPGWGRPGSSPSAIPGKGFDLSGLKAEEITQRLKQFESLANIGMLAASVSHEVNNSLDGIKNYLYLISSETPPEHHHKEYLKIVESELDRTGKIIRQLLDLYKPTKAPFQEVNGNEIIEQTLLLLGKPLRQKKYNMTLNLDKNLPTIKGVPDQLKQVFLNLFFNAIQAMPTGGGLQITSRPIADDPSSVEFIVSDTGTGIPLDRLDKIFEPFYTTKPGGTGLGLAVCRQIIHEHTGEITVEANDDAGTTFRIFLPIWSKPDDRSREKKEK